MNEKPTFGLNPIAILAVSAIILIVFLTVRNTGVYATIMWDEWEYDRYTRLLPLADADVPYYLYFFLYGITRSFGDHFLTAAQILNAIFYAASMPFIYLTCRSVATPQWALLIAVMSVFGGVNVYATHFMPEAMYFFAFWLGTWKLIGIVDVETDPIKIGLAAGSGLAFISIIKLHGMFLVPGIILFFVLCCRGGLIAGKWRGCIKVVAFTILAYGAVRFSLGYLFAGGNGFHLAGTTYGQAADATPLTQAALIQLAEKALPFVVAHIGAVIAMYSLPCLLMVTIQRQKSCNRAEQKQFSIRILTVSLLLPLVVVTSIYTARVSQLDPLIEGANGLLRLHLRYYNFLFPLFAILAAANASNGARVRPPVTLSRLIAAFVIAAVSIVFVCQLPLIQISVSDGPELRGFATVQAVSYILTAITVACSVIWLFNVGAASKLYLFAFLPIFSLMGAGAATYSAYKEKTPTVADLAGTFAKNQLGENTARMATIGPTFVENYQAMFYADNPYIKSYYIPQKSCVTFTKDPEGKEWMLLIGDYHLESPVKEAFIHEGFELVHTDPSIVTYQDCPISGSH